MDRGRKRNNEPEEPGTPPAGLSVVQPLPKQPRSAYQAVTPAVRGTEQQQTEPTATLTRSLFPENGALPVVTPDRESQKLPPSPAKRKLIFGKSVVEVTVLESVRKVYRIIKKRTGSIGGNSSFGPIYGELTMGSMQKMVNLMKEHTGFDASSRFIDVGSGVGKPNLHVAQDPGVELSYGIEVEADRWLLSMHGLQGTLEAVSANNDVIQGPDMVKGRCIFVRGDIRDANVFDPFTHVYMFSIGFPPTLWCELADMWNRSFSPYLICFHGPRDIIHSYGFEVELLVQAPTSMHGSKEGHMGYLYKRTSTKRTSESVPCDPYFEPAWGLVKAGVEALQQDVAKQLDTKMNAGTSTRSRRSL